MRFSVKINEEQKKQNEGNAQRQNDVVFDALGIGNRNRRRTEIFGTDFLILELGIQIFEASVEVFNQLCILRSLISSGFWCNQHKKIFSILMHQIAVFHRETFAGLQSLEFF